VEPLSLVNPAVICLVVAAMLAFLAVVFFFSSRRRHTRSKRDWSSDVCSSDLILLEDLLNPAVFLESIVMSHSLHVILALIQAIPKYMGVSPCKKSHQRFLFLLSYHHT